MVLTQCVLICLCLAWAELLWGTLVGSQGFMTWTTSGSFFCGQTASYPQAVPSAAVRENGGHLHPPPEPCRLSCATDFSVTPRQTRPAQPVQSQPLLSPPAPLWGGGRCPAEAPSPLLPASSSCCGFGLECGTPSRCLCILLLGNVNCDTLGQGLSLRF